MSMLPHMPLGPVLLMFASLAVAQNSAQPTTGESTQTGDASKSARIEIADSTPAPEAGSGAASGPVSGRGPIVNAVTATPTKNPKLRERQEWFQFDRRPRLVLEPSLNLNGGGFQPVSTSISGGLSLESKDVILEGLAGYHPVGKVNDGTGDNPKGHIKSLDASAYYRLPNYWFFGTSGGWGKLSTTNYSKQMWSMNFGAGTDMLTQDTSFRLSASYAPPAFDYRNGSQGVTFQFIIPSPLEQGHVMFFEDLYVGHLHDTITDPNDRTLTELQKSHGHFTASCSFKLLLRF
ncbi:MAG TPA: hypothetical protein VEK84_14300 [Terriglobales bacterium]|nr:hypothetical protein [Terriglobales bacterium]